MLQWGELSTVVNATFSIHIIWYNKKITLLYNTKYNECLDLDLFASLRFWLAKDQYYKLNTVQCM